MVDGQNSIAIQVHNANENLNDLTALPILSFYTEDPPVPSDSYEIKITINTDSYPGETSWQLIGINGTFYDESVLPGSITQSNTYMNGPLMFHWAITSLRSWIHEAMEFVAKMVCQ